MIRQTIVSSAIVGLLGVFGLTTGCSSAQSDSDSGEEATGSAAEKIDAICGGSAVASIDGIPAYSYCGTFDVWSNNGVDVRSTPGPGPGWVQSEAGYGFQCFELAARYMHFKWKVPAAWGVLYASQMCDTHPAGVTVTKNPVHGDLIVFAGGSCGIAAPAGHVAVVQSVGASTITAVQQNVAATITWQKSCASCFLHASANGSDDPCAGAEDGFYCAASPQLTGGKKGDYYDCRGGVTKSKVTCGGGCEVNPPGVADVCHTASTATDAGLASDAAATDAATDDAATDDADAAANHVETPSTVAEPQASPEPESASSEGGCSMSPRGDAASSSWLFLVLGAALLRRRRARLTAGR